MTDNTTDAFYNKFIERLRIKLDDMMIASLRVETQLHLAEDKIHRLLNEKETLEKKIESLEQKVKDLNVK